MIIKRLYNLPTVTLRSAFSEIERMKDVIDRLTGGLSRTFYGEPGPGVFPLINIIEDAENYRIRAELPGVNAADLDITATGNNVSISGERKIPGETEGAKYHRREREAGKFSRMVSLPRQIDSERVNANLTNGILTVTLPKAAVAKHKKITIN